MADLTDRIDNDFAYHAPKPEASEKFMQLRGGARVLAEYIALNVPPGREQALALTKLEEAVMWANAGIARAE